MALTPGRTPLPGSPPRYRRTATTLSDTNTTNTIVSKSTTPNLGTPDIRLGIFAKPGGQPTTVPTERTPIGRCRMR